MDITESVIHIGKNCHFSIEMYYVGKIHFWRQTFLVMTYPSPRSIKILFCVCVCLFCLSPFEENNNFYRGLTFFFISFQGFNWLTKCFNVNQNHFFCLFTICNTNFVSSFMVPSGENEFELKKKKSTDIWWHKIEHSHINSKKSTTKKCKKQFSQLK